MLENFDHRIQLMLKGCHSLEYLRLSIFIDDEYYFIQPDIPLDTTVSFPKLKKLQVEVTHSEDFKLTDDDLEFWKMLYFQDTEVECTGWLVYDFTEEVDLNELAAIQKSDSYKPGPDDCTYAAILRRPLHYIS
eukprot:TRINITY_DN17585_c0_g1_i1.p1 TRINITY_DN17585_c0_g1~~TRINITY_DN17585_c0_g1_i1.p1  ORF type:complete len:133 (-),score=11.35 TRINITY_DN17585_c0_g1_i1:114-512(-)